MHTKFDHAVLFHRHIHFFQIFSATLSGDTRVFCIVRSLFFLPSYRLLYASAPTTKSFSVPHFLHVGGGGLLTCLNTIVAEIRGLPERENLIFLVDKFNGLWKEELYSHSNYSFSLPYMDFPTITSPGM